MYAWTDGDNSANVLVVEFFFFTVQLIKTYLIIHIYKNSIEITTFMFTDLIRFGIMGQLTAFFSLSNET